MMMARSFLLIVVSALFMCALGCKEEKTAASNEPPDVRGRKLYMQYCVSCHNSNPFEDGLIGPANGDSSLELVRSKVLKNEYPAGYKPKRATKAMMVFPGMPEEDLIALHAFLNKK